MFNYDYQEFQKAVTTLELIGVENRNDIKAKYQKLSKKYHPDMPNGDVEKFQELTKAYKILLEYVDNFKFRFTQDEFSSQYPFSFEDLQKWKRNTI